MNKEIIKKIELLIEMSGTLNTYETLSEELVSLNQDIERQKNIVKDLKKSMTDQKYVKANERIIDENIKIGIENRLDFYRQDLKELESKIQNASTEEESIHNQVVSFERELRQLKQFLESLDLKMKTIGAKDSDVYSFYVSLVDQASDDVLKVQDKLNKSLAHHSSITEELENLGNSKTALENKVLKEQERLEEVEEALRNPRTYVDHSKKTLDEVSIDRYNSELEALEQRRLEILTDPAYIGHEAKELYLEDDKTSALNKLKELVTIVLSKPFMDVRYEDLDELLEDAVNKRDEFANVIENKSYDGEDISVIEMRIRYLEEQEKEYEQKINELESRISHIDLEMVRDLVQNINQVKVVRDHLCEAIERYKIVIEENEEQKSPKKKASLKAALKRKQEELSNVEHILSDFESELELMVMESKRLEEEELVSLKNKLEQIQEEMNRLHKYQVMDIRSKDILEVEKDKDDLKKLSDTVQNIMNRKKYEQTASDLYDEIELSFGTDLEEEDIPLVSSSPVDLEDYRIDTMEEEVAENPLEDISVSPITPLDEGLGDILEEDIPEQEVNAKRFKVLKVEPIDEKEENVDSVTSFPETDFMINDFGDDEYISFNDLLEDSKNGN